MIINRISKDFDKGTRKIVVKSLVLSVVNYCINIWGSCNKTLIHSVQKLQNFTAKIGIGGARKYNHVTPLRKELQRLTITDKDIFEKYIMVYEVINGLHSELLLKFPTVRENTASTTRQENSCMYKEQEQTLAQGPLMCVDLNSGTICLNVSSA